MVKGNRFKLKESRVRLDVREDIFYDYGGEMLAQVPLENLTGWVSEQHDLFEDDPTYGKGFGLDDLQSSLPAQNILWFYDKSLI